jgi:cardiolipin synthase
LRTVDDGVATQYRRVLEGVIGVPATEGNEIVVLRNGDEIFPAMLEAIRAAEHTIDMLTFVYWSGATGSEFADALSERAERGIRVRLLLDAWGALPMDKSVLEQMSSSGVRVRWFRPFRKLSPGKLNHRTHRKVMVVDEAVAFTGGVGIADEWRGDARSPQEWRDTHFRLRGPVVDGLRAAFLDNWVETDPELFDSDSDRFPEQAQPGAIVAQCVRGAAEVGYSDIRIVIQTLLQLAQQRVRIATAYFVPDDGLLDCLVEAAERGVEIDLLVPGPHIDKRFVLFAGERAFATLLDSGIRVWRFLPTMLHAKIMTVDGVIANVGSANFNARSTALDEEINVIVMDRGVVATIDAHFDEDLTRSERITEARWARRPLPQRAVELASAPFRRFF